MTALQLRDYQRQAIDELRRRWDAGAVRVPMVLAGGLGKTVIFSTMIEEWLSEPANRGKRALIIAHTDELISQAMNKMRAVAPHRRVGRVQGTKFNNVTAEVIVSSRQTLANKKRRDQLRNVGVIVIDECHHAVASNTYGTILRHFGALPGDDVVEDPSIKVAGFTATLARGDKAKLSSVWEECTFERDIMFGIRRGYLLDVKGEQIIIDDLNLGNVKTVGGDYSETSLAEELERTFAVETIAKEYARLAGQRKGVAFWPLVATAEHAADVFNAAGIPSAVVHGKTDKEERKKILRDLHDGRIQVVHNPVVLTEGWDEPTVDVVLVGRFTKSPVLGPQMVYRGNRPDLTIPPEQRKPMLLITAVGAGINLRPEIDLSPERMQQIADDHPDATLSELEEYFAEEIEEEIGEQRAGASYGFESEEYAGATTTKSFDPLGRKSVWGKTPGGTYYSKAGAGAYVFVVESLAGEPSNYDVVICSTNETFNPRYDALPPWQRGTEHVDLHLDMALSFAEEVADDLGQGQALSSRASAWRKREPSTGMKRLAQFKYGIEAGEMNGGELSEAIDAAQAARRIDPLVVAVRSNVQ